MNRFYCLTAYILLAANAFATDTSSTKNLLPPINKQEIFSHRSMFEATTRSCKRRRGRQGCRGPRGPTGPAGPSFNNYLSMFTRETQIPISAPPTFTPVSWGDQNPPYQSTGQWVFMDPPNNTILVSNTSGQYLVTFKANFDGNNPDLTHSPYAFAIQTSIGGPFSVLPDSYAQYVIPDTGGVTAGSLVTLEATTFMNYHAGDPVTFEYYGANLTSRVPYGASDNISAAVSIVRVN